MPGEDPGLVVRATLPNMTFARETANDRFYISMYDGSTPAKLLAVFDGPVHQPAARVVSGESF